MSYTGPERRMYDPGRENIEEHILRATRRAARDVLEVTDERAPEIFTEGVEMARLVRAKAALEGIPILTKPRDEERIREVTEGIDVKRIARSFEMLILKRNYARFYYMALERALQDAYRKAGPELLPQDAERIALRFIDEETLTLDSQSQSDEFRKAWLFAAQEFLWSFKLCESAKFERDRETFSPHSTNVGDFVTHAVSARIAEGHDSPNKSAFFRGTLNMILKVRLFSFVPPEFHDALEKWIDFNTGIVATQTEAIIRSPQGFISTLCESALVVAAETCPNLRQFSEHDHLEEITQRAQEIILPRYAPALRTIPDDAFLQMFDCNKPENATPEAILEIMIQKFVSGAANLLNNNVVVPGPDSIQ